jgi:hypothetical protein
MLTQDHPVEGYFEFVPGNDTVTLRCHWPADLNANDWIDIENHYHILNYLQAVNDSMSTGNGEARGISGGYMRVISIANGFILEFSRPQNGWAACSLRLNIRRPISDLIPRRNMPSVLTSINLGRACHASRAWHTRSRWLPGGELKKGSEGR